MKHDEHEERDNLRDSGEQPETDDGGCGNDDCPIHKPGGIMDSLRSGEIKKTERKFGNKTIVEVDLRKYEKRDSASVDRFLEALKEAVKNAKPGSVSVENRDDDDDAPAYTPQEMADIEEKVQKSDAAFERIKWHARYTTVVSLVVGWLLAAGFGYVAFRLYAAGEIETASAAALSGVSLLMNAVLYSALLTTKKTSSELIIMGRDGWGEAVKINAKMSEKLIKLRGSLLEATKKNEELEAALASAKKPVTKRKK